MRSSRDGSTVATVLGIVLLVVSVAILGGHYFGQGRAGRTLSSASLPLGLGLEPSSVSAPPTAGAPTAGAPTAGAPTAGAPAPSHSPTAVRASPKAVPAKLGVPAQLVVVDHHVKASVSANRLNPDGSLYVPPNPGQVSWGSQQVAPGSGHGTTILVSHINSGGVDGAFSDLADYRVGQIITVVLADHRKLKYAVAAPPMEVNKDQVGRRRQELFDQTHSYGLSGRPRSGRLLLLSCGGAFDNRTGHYESNIFVYALPVD